MKRNRRREPKRDRRSGDTEYTREHARIHFILAVRRIRPACFIALGRATLAPAGEVEHEVRRWAECWGLTAEWCIRWARDACRDNRDSGEICGLPIPVQALSRGPHTRGPLPPLFDGQPPQLPSCGLDGCPGFLRWFQQQKLADLVEWFDDSDLWELAGVEDAGSSQRKGNVHKRLKDACGKLVTVYLNGVEAHYSPKPFPDVAFEWLARRVVPLEATGRVETWEAIAPGLTETTDPENPSDGPNESTVRKVATALARFIDLPLPDRTEGR